MATIMTDYCPECGMERQHEPSCRMKHYDFYSVIDPINKPEHYNYGKTETIDYIMQVATLYPGHQAVLVGNVIKYISRAPLKGDKEKDLKKAQWYLNKLLEAL